MVATLLIRSTVCYSLATSSHSPANGRWFPKKSRLDGVGISHCWCSKKSPRYPRCLTSKNSPDDDDDDVFERHYARFVKFRSSPHNAPHIKKVFLLSDLHCDYAPNREWLRHICSSEAKIDEATNIDFNKTMILVAGDVSHDLTILRWTFQLLKRTFGEVAFVPGNHELWLDKKRKIDKNDAPMKSNCTGDEEVDDELIFSNGQGDGCNDSIEKLEKILQICVEEDVRIGPVKVGCHETHPDYIQAHSIHHNATTNYGVWVIPILSFHHTSFDTEPHIDTTAWKGIPSARRVVADYRRTKWPQPLSLHDDSVAKFFDGLNEVILNLDNLLPNEHAGWAAPILTFSHFLPRIELMPEKRYLSIPTLHSCVGSIFLESRLRNIGRLFGIDEYGSYGSEVSLHENVNSGKGVDHLHAFGHSHLSWDAVIEGIRYVHVPLAYPKEWEQRRRSLEIGSMKGAVREKRFPVCIWSNDNEQCDTLSNHCGNGFPKDWLGGWWSKYYSIMDRQPHRNNELAPWVAQRFRKLPKGVVSDFDHSKVEMEHKLQHPSHWAASGQWYDRNKSK